jgi:hypothetical protein
MSDGLLIKCRFCGAQQTLPDGGGQLVGCCDKLRDWPADRAGEAYELRVLPPGQLVRVK